jgi:secreted trypsin-like serine protease
LDQGFRGGYPEVVAGNLVISTNTGEHLAVWRAYRHPAFNEKTYANDYALLRLKVDAKEPLVKLASADEVRALLPNTELTTAGWGDLVEDAGLGSDDLRYIKLPLIERSACEESWGELGPETICAGAPGGGRDTCQGDSGGPLFAQIGGVQKQVALVSSGDGCARPNTPGLYAEVPFASEWIKVTKDQGERDFSKLGTCVASCD